MRPGSHPQLRLLLDGRARLCKYKLSFPYQLYILDNEAKKTVTVNLFWVPTMADFSTAYPLSIKIWYWKPSLKCSLRYKYGKSTGHIKGLHSVMFGLFLRNCITPFSSNCKNMLCHYWYLLTVPMDIEYSIWIHFSGIILWYMNGRTVKNILTYPNSN